MLKHKSSMLNTVIAMGLMNAVLSDAANAQDGSQSGASTLTNDKAAEAAQIAALQSTIKANFDNKVDVRETKFHFKKVKDDATGLESKRPTVTLQLPTPSVEGIIAILENGGKGLDLLLEAVSEVVTSRAREIINEKEDITQDNFPMEELAWETIANLPKAERRGGGIAKDTWEAFGKDYTTVMPALTGKSVEKIGNQVKIFLNKFAQIKREKPVLKLLKDQLALYVTSAPNAEEYAECVEFLVNKADALINVKDEDLLTNL